jgi:hypothetical protein
MLATKDRVLGVVGVADVLQRTAGGAIARRNKLGYAIDK